MVFNSAGVSVEDLKTPFVIAHRGCPAIAPENTMESFRLAANTPVPAIETDVRMLADGSMGIMHDSTTNRMTTASGKVSALTAAAWRKLVTRVAGNQEALGNTTYQLLGEGKDAWSGLYHPPMQQLYDEFAARKVLWFDCKSPGSCLAVHKMTREYVNKTGTVVQYGSLADKDFLAAIADGLTGSFLWDGAASFSDIHDAGCKWVAMSLARATFYNISAARAVGLKVAVWTINRLVDYKALPSVVDAVFSDDPFYVMGFVNRNYNYRLTADPFAVDTWYHGMPGSGELMRGYFTGGRFGFDYTSGPSKNFTLQGWACPLPDPTSYEIKFTVTFDKLDTSDTRWAAIGFADPTDVAYKDISNATQNGYVLILRQNGELHLFKRVNGLLSDVEGVRTEAINAPGATAEISVQVTPSQIICRRRDGKGAVIQSDDTTHRGAYFFLGAAASTGPNFLQVSFDNVSVTSPLL